MGEWTGDGVRTAAEVVMPIELSRWWVYVGGSDMLRTLAGRDRRYEKGQVTLMLYAACRVDVEGGRMEKVCCIASCRSSGLVVMTWRPANARLRLRNDQTSAGLAGLLGHRKYESSLYI